MRVLALPQASMPARKLAWCKLSGSQANYTSQVDLHDRVNLSASKLSERMFEAVRNTSLVSQSVEMARHSYQRDPRVLISTTEHLA